MPPKKVKAEEQTCDICCSPINKSTRKEISCNFCSSKACLECIKRFLLDTIGDYYCMFCKNKWSRDILVEKLPQVFIKDELRENQENKIVDLEKARLPEAQSIAETRIKQKKIQQFREATQTLTSDYTDNQSQRDLLKLIARSYGIVDDVNIDTDIFQIVKNLETTEEPVQKKTYVRQCPNSECRGFINADWNCGLCDTKMCKKCYEKVDEDEIKTHICDPAILETNKVLAKDSKPCPKCGALITKLSGCFGKDTPIRMWNGTIKMSQDIVVGDELVSSDYTKRIVDKLVNGTGELYQISQSNGMSYIVTGDHKLVLYFPGESEGYFNLTVDNYKKIDYIGKKQLFGFKSHNYKNYYDYSTITIKSLGRGEYYGWAIKVPANSICMADQEHLFLLSDNTVVHNCDQMWCTSCHTAFSWTKGTIEKGHIHNPHFYNWQMSQKQENTTQNNVNICDENNFPTITQLLTHRDRFDNYCQKWIPRFHQYIIHMNRVNRPIYQQTLATDEKMEINVSYLMTIIGKSEWKKQLYLADKRQELARDVLDLIDMTYTVAGERFRNFIADINSNKLGFKGHIVDIEKLIDYTTAEVEKIRKRYMTKNVIISEPEWLDEIKSSKSI
jgi:hypothetical protein